MLTLPVKSRKYVSDIQTLATNMFDLWKFPYLDKSFNDVCNCYSIKDNNIVIEMPGFSKDNIEVVLDEKTHILSIKAEQVHEITNENKKFDLQLNMSDKYEIENVTYVNGELIIKLKPLENEKDTLKRLEIE